MEFNSTLLFLVIFFPLIFFSKFPKIKYSFEELNDIGFMGFEGDMFSFPSWISLRNKEKKN